MAELLVKFDPEIEFEPIVDIMYAPPADAASGDDNPDEQEKNPTIDQTKVTGIVAPLIRINNLNIDWSCVQRFELGIRDCAPYLYVTCQDMMNIAKTFDRPGSDNILRLQILPQHDNTYKKINMNFYIVHFDTPDDEILSLSCVYMAPNLWNSELKSYGKISTYEFYEQIAHSCKLGLVSNLSGTDDVRYIYSPNKTSLDMIETVYKDGGGSDKVVLDCWIDYWNNIVLANMYDRWDCIEEDIKYWTGKYIPDLEAKGPETPEEIDRIITNANGHKQRELYITEYDIVNNTSANVYAGTDKVVSIYNYDNLEGSNLLIEDADTKNNIFKKYIYGGEYFGDFNYIRQRWSNESFLQKVNSQLIKVTLHTPCLGIMKGDKVNLLWFDMNNFTASSAESVSEDVNTNIPMAEEEGTEGLQDEFIVNKQVSGQYLIVKQTFKFHNYGGDPKWEQELLLSRPADQIFNYANAIKSLNDENKTE